MEEIKEKLKSELMSYWLDCFNSFDQTKDIKPKLDEFWERAQIEILGDIYRKSGTPEHCAELLLSKLDELTKPKQ